MKIKYVYKCDITGHKTINVLCPFFVPISRLYFHALKYRSCTASPHRSCTASPRHSDTALKHHIWYIHKHTNKINIFMKKVLTF